MQIFIAARSREHMDISGLDVKEYTRMMVKAAVGLWGEEKAEEMRAHIESVSKAVWVVGDTQLDPRTEPVIKLVHRRDE